MTDATKDQITAIMMLHGTPKQQREAEMQISKEVPMPMTMTNSLIPQILSDLRGVIRVRGIEGATVEERIEKMEEEMGEFRDALKFEGFDQQADEGADVIIATAITMMQQGINPFSALVAKLDKMQLETPWRKAEPEYDYTKVVCLGDECFPGGA